ncbi:MAG: hypothetical protein QOC92_4523 [Acidimicrobiaceae bacterium]
MKRFLAIAGAVAMVCLAIVIRAGIDRGGSNTTTPSGPVKIACITELEAQCRALSSVSLRVEDAAVTAKAIATGTADIDGWITIEPWPAIVNQLAQTKQVGASTPIARTELVIAMVKERADVLAAKCGGSIGWRCLGDAIGKQWTELGGMPEWGAVKAGLPPASTASGLVLLGNAASGYFGRTDFATNDFDGDFGIWRSKVTATAASFDDFILKFPAAFSAVGATRAVVTTSSGTRAVATITPAPAASAVIVLAPVNGGRIGSVAKDVLARALNSVGWSTDNLSAPSGLPNAGVLLALSGLK